MLRVANALSENQGTADDAPSEAVSSSAIPVSAPVATPPPVAPVPVAQPPPVAPATSAKDNGAGLPKERVAAKFKEYIAQNKTPNEAAILAIQDVRRDINAKAAAAAAASAAVNPAVPEQDDNEKLAELAAMGFVDETRNRALIKKYAGRMDRVVEALVGGS